MKTAKTNHCHLLQVAYPLSCRLYRCDYFHFYVALIRAEAFVGGECLGPALAITIDFYETLIPIHKHLLKSGKYRHT
jgi:hypothetical protein